MYPTRSTWGTTSLKSSSHLPLIKLCQLANPVRLALGRVSLLTKPGTDRVGDGYENNRYGADFHLNNRRRWLVLETITSGVSLINSKSVAHIDRHPSPGKRTSMRILRPSSQPSLCIKNSPGRRRDLRVKMWGTSSPHDKLAGNLGHVIEAAQIGRSRSDRVKAGRISPGNLRLLQQYRHQPTILQRLIILLLPA